MQPEQAQNPQAMQRPMPNCFQALGAYFKNMPIVTLILFAFTGVSTLAFFIASCVISGFANYYLSSAFEHVALYPKNLVLKYQLWRIATPHFVGQSIWSWVFVALIFLQNSYILERYVGTKKFVFLLLCCVVCTSVIATALAAFFFYTPEINKWSYFTEVWNDVSSIGPQTLMLFVTRINLMVTRQKSIFCSCCMLPSWVYMIILCVIAQMSIYPMWHAVNYNMSAIVVSFFFPRKFLRPCPKFVADVEKYLQRFPQIARVREDIPEAQDIDNLPTEYAPADPPDEDARWGASGRRIQAPRGARRDTRRGGYQRLARNEEDSPSPAAEQAPQTTATTGWGGLRGRQL